MQNRANSIWRKPDKSVEHTKQTSRTDADQQPDTAQQMTVG